MNSKTLLFVLCIGLTILSGILRGVVDQRWGVEGMEEAAVRVEDMPEEVGPWKMVHDGDLDAEAAKMLRCAGSIVRNYVHQGTGEGVSLIFLVGPAGPLAQHTPEVCYGSGSFTIAEPTRNTVIQEVGDEKNDFLVVTFSENHVGNRLLRVYYAWNNKGKWLAPSQPRAAFAGIPMLYKVQIATNALGDKNTQDAAARFLQACLPIWKEICR